MKAAWNIAEPLYHSTLQFYSGKKRFKKASAQLHQAEMWQALPKSEPESGPLHFDAETLNQVGITHDPVTSNLNDTVMIMH